MLEGQLENNFRAEAAGDCQPNQEHRDNSLRSEFDMESGVEQLNANNKDRREEKKLQIQSAYSSKLTLELRLYSGSTSGRKYRARLLWTGMPSPYVETYCNSEKEAKRWVTKTGEDALIKKLKPDHLKQIGSGMLFRMAINVLPDEIGVCRYFSERPDLLKALSKKPIPQMSEIDFEKAIRAGIVDEKSSTRDDIQQAVRMVNVVLSMCHTYGILHKRVRIHYNAHKTDKFFAAMQRALGHFVIPEALCTAMYCRFVDRMQRNDYYLGALLAMLMGLTRGEICALKYCDICGVGEPWQDGDDWRPPKSRVWALKIRRFYRRSIVEGTQKQILTLAASPYKYRLLVIPPHLRNVLANYIQLKGEAVRGDSFLIPAHKGNNGVRPDGMQKFLKSILNEPWDELGGRSVTEAMMRQVFLPAKDHIGVDEWKKLILDINVFRNTLQYKLERYCSFEPHEVRSYLGLPPYATIDKHYWEARDEFALLRMYGKMFGWDLRAVPWTQVPKAETLQKTGKIVSANIHPPISYTVDATMVLQGQPGEPLFMDLMAQYGFSCRYTVTHSEEDVERLILGKRDMYAEVDGKSGSV